MRVWRISNYADLRGLGGIRAGGRWHSPGHPIVYCADHPAAALLEILVHLEFPSTDMLPMHYQLFEIDIPERLKVAKLATEHLDDDWRNREDTTRPVGDEWMRAGKASVLRVPSAITPHAHNYLINPRHADATSIKIASVARHPFDVRLFKVV